MLEVLLANDPAVAVRRAEVVALPELLDAKYARAAPRKVIERCRPDGAEADDAEALYDGSNRNLIGVRNFLSGTPQLRERWKRAIDSANSAMGDTIGRLYVQKYFEHDAKVKAEAMVADLIRAFGRRIDNLSWMSPQTRAKAKEKLATLKVGVGYPDNWRDYSGLKISRDSTLQNAIQAELYEYHRSLAKIGNAVDRSEWWMTPQTVNAVNLPIRNGHVYSYALNNY